MTKLSVQILRLVSILSFTAFLTNCGVEDLSLRGLRGNKKSGDATSLKGSTTASQPAAKATAAFSDVAIMDQGDVNYTTILSQSLKSSNRSLFIDMSLECG